MQIQGKDMDQNARPRQTAPGIRSTISYIIFLDHVLGQGATSKVYLGRHKKSGKRVACKVPHPDYPYRGSADMERESKVLLHLKHPNILCLEAIETDQISKERILFMELCAAGSLYDMLEKPQHANGLQEEIFLQVFNDITCGMKYLRDKGLVHRDVKPGNIMCFTDEKGRTIYKLADFGAARKLADEENFTSLYGTEEYLHPHMFQKAVLKEKSDQHFDARVDLWSIGITLYHLATGLLPFRPQGGRKNSPMMHYLTTEKAPGVISGVQTGPGRDDVIWSSELPESCQLSVGLKNLLTPLLASLLELDSMKVWSFTQFFEASQSILSRKVLHVLWVDRASNLRVYSKATDTFAVVQEAITAQTRLSAGKQIFFIDGDVYQADRKCTAADLPRTSRGKPIMLYSRGAAEASQISPPFVATMPVLHPRYSTQNDYPIAKGAVAAGYVLQRRQEQLHEMSDHFDRFVEVVRSNLLTDGLRLQADSASLRGELEASALEIQLSARALNALTQSSEKDIAAKAQMLCRELYQWKAIFGEHERQCRDVAVNLHSLLSELQRPDGLRALWKPSQGCGDDGDACTAELVHLISEMEEIFRRFAKDKKLGKLSYNEEQIHKMEKLNLGEKMKQMKACTVKCEQRWRNQHTLLMEWNDKASNQRRRIQLVHTTLATVTSSCQGLKKTIADVSIKATACSGSCEPHILHCR
ncbi:inhibitor of nuclear factor kappa-B kinase subunit epsilon-like [Diadema antillarum]|uniref:inhibitor of nuclear factor kappa-B kinase subunit epsilon-like n=1 Tax=Diadema antillarum TaxID=105358 RepID=UPI003A83EB0C